MNRPSEANLSVNSVRLNELELKDDFYLVCMQRKEPGSTIVCFMPYLL